MVFGCQSPSKEIRSPLPGGALNGPTNTKLKSFQDIGVVNSGVSSGAISSREAYVPQQRLKISHAEQNYSGSLFNPASISSNLYLDNLPIGVGSTVNLYVKEVRSDGEEQASADVNEESADELTEELLKALPTLAPEDGSSKKALTVVKAKVIERLPNGDLVVEAKRTSEASGRLNFVFFRGVLPSGKIRKSEKALITDLVDVTFQEQGSGEFVERQSSGWEDEYTLRYSGFIEVPTKLSRKLEGDRKSLLSLRGRFENRLKSFKNEREKIARERSDIYDQNSKIREKMADNENRMEAIEQTLEDRNRTIAQREDKIKQLEEEIFELNKSSGSSQDTAQGSAQQGETNGEE